MRPEQEIQKAVLAHLKMRGAKDIFYFHCPNGGFRKPIEAAIFKSMGLVAGIPDLIIIRKLGQWSCQVFALELKDNGRRGKKLTDHEIEQEKVRVRMQAVGVITDVTYGLNETITWLEGHGLLKGTMS